MSTVDIDRDRMAALVRRIEADAHRGGWDGPPALFLLYDDEVPGAAAHYRQALPYGPPKVNDGYAAVPMVDREILRGASQHALFRMALNLSEAGHPVVEGSLRRWRHPGFLGVAFRCECWTFRGTQEQLAATGYVMGSGKQRLADTPGSIEQRYISAVDVAGGLTYLERLRGTDPVLLHGEVVSNERVGRVADEQAAEPGTAPGIVLAGSVPQALRCVVAVIAGQEPTPIESIPVGWDWDAEAERSAAAQSADRGPLGRLPKPGDWGIRDTGTGSREARRARKRWFGQ